MSDGNKTFKLTDSKNYDALLKAYGLNEETVQQVLKSPETINIAKEGDNFTFTRDFGGRVTTTKFRLDEEFDESRADGTKGKTLVTPEGRGFRFDRKTEDGRHSATVMKVEGDTLTSESTFGDVVSTRTYKA